MAEVHIAAGEFYAAPDGWRWRTLGANGEPLGSGESYVRKEDVLAVLRAHLPEGAEPEEVED